MQCGLLLVSLLMVNSIQAVNNPLNVIMVAVNDYSQQELTTVLPSAMGSVLIKMSGNPKIMQIPEVINALAKAQDYMQSYTYHQEYQQGQIQLKVRIVFNRKSLEQLLQQVDQQLWASKPLPQVLVWIKTSNQEINMNDYNPNNAFINQLLKQSKRQGLSIIFPEGDLQDNNMVGINQSLLFNDGTLQQLAKRYGVAAVLVGEIKPGSQARWSSQWKLLWQGQIWQWQKNSDQKILLARAVFSQLIKQFTMQDIAAADNGLLNEDEQPQLSTQATTINSQTASTTESAMPNIQPNSTSTSNATTTTVANQGSNSSYGFMMSISGVNNLNDYTHVMNYLRHLSIVTNVSVNHMDKNNLILQVEAIGGQNALNSVLSTSSRLHLLSQKSSVLYYRWKKKTMIQNSSGQNNNTPTMQFINDNS